MNLTTRAQRYLRLDLTLEDALPTRMPVYVNSVAYLFGAATPLEECVSNAVAWAGVSIADAITMATDHPARLLGLAPRVLEKGAPADLIVFAWENGRIRVTAAVVGGKYFSSTPQAGW